MHRSITSTVGRALAFATLLASGPSVAQDAGQSVREFYAGKTIDMIIGYSPGGTYDQYARLVARFLPEYIPGNPVIVPRNMPGASSRLAAAYVYNVAPQDGTVLATADQSLSIAQAMGDTTLKLDAGKFNYIGSPAMENNVLITWHESGVKTVEDAIETPITIGATGGSTSSQYPAIMNSVLGTQFEIITGYPGGSEINFAMESGEVDGRGSANWASVKSGMAEWLEKGLINIVVQIGLEPEPAISDVPLLKDLAGNEADGRLLRLLSAPTSVGRPIFTTPNVPEDRVQALREAFDTMAADPDFIAAAAKENLDVRPVSGARLEEVVQEILATPPEIGQRLGEYIGVQQ